MTPHRSVHMLLIVLYHYCKLSLTNADIISTNTTVEYKNKTITCAPNEPCTVICQHIEACFESTIHCPTANTCDIKCNHSRSCAHSLIHAEHSSYFRLLDCAMGSFTCMGITIYFPSNNQGTPISHIIGADTGLSAGSSTGYYPLQFYAINGWNDINVTTGPHFSFSSAHIGVMHCADAYSVTCDFAPDAWECADTDDICNDPPPPTTAPPSKHPTLQPTVNPSSTPTLHPSLNPSGTPTIPPTSIPSTSPTLQPTDIPSMPSIPPTISPTKNPVVSTAPTITSINPSKHPTLQPTFNPTIPPTNIPTQHPTITPIINPTKHPIVPQILTILPIDIVTTEDIDEHITSAPSKQDSNDADTRQSDTVVLYRKYMLYVIIALCGICITLTICCLCKLQKPSKVAKPAPMSPLPITGVSGSKSRPIDYNTHQQYIDAADSDDVHDEEEKAMFADHDTPEHPKHKHKQKIPSSTVTEKSMDKDEYIFTENQSHFQKSGATGTPYMLSNNHVTPMGVESYDYGVKSEENLAFQDNLQYNQNQFPHGNYDYGQNPQGQYVSDTIYTGYQGDPQQQREFAGYGGNVNRNQDERQFVNDGNVNQEKKYFLSGAQNDVMHHGKPTPQ